MNGIRLYTSNYLETLVEQLADSLRTPLASPLREELIVVQSSGMQRWVSMQLAEHHGICANYRFPFPNAFLDEMFRAVVPDTPENSPFEPEIMTWRIMKLLAVYRERPKFEGLAGYLGGDVGGLKSLQLAERIADLFDQYLLFRPEMVLRWQLGEEDHWQAVLWRALAKGRESEHRAALAQRFLERLRQRSADAAGLPERISIFGISALPRFHLQMIAALAQAVQVNLFLMNPCSQYWGDILSERAMSRVLAGRDISPEALHLERGNSLLASMGALGRDFWDAISEFDCRQSESYRESGEGTLLACVQSDILNLRERGGDGEGRKVIAADDASLQIHSCHSSMREMEVLYDSLLAMFDSDPRLMPRDILVMTPDIEAYAPYIEAVFDTPADEARRIPYSIADQSLRRESRVVGAFLTVLELWGGRFKASEVLAVLESPSVRRKFGLAEDDLETILHWIQAAQIRWGVDELHRQRLDLPAFAENTWRAGLDRLLLGYAMPAKEFCTFGGIAPCDVVEGSDALLLGRFVEFQDKLFKLVQALDEARPLTAWSRCLSDLVEELFAPEESSLGELQALRRNIVELAELAKAAEFEGPVDLAVVKNHLRHRLERDGFGYGFISGGVTFCAMLPMRSIPHKVICLVGMNNDAYPRQTKTLGFDLMAKHPQKGDRSRRNDDRYLFLESILSAREKLYISYLGQSIQDNSAIPPSVLVSELTDYVETGFVGQEQGILPQIVTQHRLQAFSPKYFDGSVSGLFSYSQEDLRAARRLLQGREAPRAFLSLGLSVPEESWKTVALADLYGFFRNPTKYLLNRRLGIHLGGDAPTLEEVELFALAGLDKYSIAANLVERGLNEQDLEESFPALMTAGLLPHGTPGKCAFADVARGVRNFVEKTRKHLDGPASEPEHIDLTVDRFRLVGKISGIFSGQLVHYRYARLKPADHLRLWIHHLAFALAVPQAERKGLLIGLSPDSKKAGWIAYQYGQPENPEELLQELLEIYWDGLVKPVHFFAQSSWKYASEILQKNKLPEQALTKAVNEWKGTDFAAGESQDPYYQLCFQHQDPIDAEFCAISIKVLGPLFDCSQPKQYSEP